MILLISRRYIGNLLLKTGVSVYSHTNPEGMGDTTTRPMYLITTYGVSGSYTFSLSVYNTALVIPDTIGCHDILGNSKIPFAAVFKL